MTADERIEKLLNRFGQTISDLPKAVVNTNDVQMAYSGEHRHRATQAALEWHLPEAADSNMQDVVSVMACLKDYVCHLADVIDRMEIALETAVRCTDCGTCEFEHTGECSGIIECNYRICDGCLMDSDGMEGC